VCCLINDAISHLGEPSSQCRTKRHQPIRVSAVRPRGGLAITDDHFDRLLAHLDAATHMLGIEPADIETLLDIVRSTRDDVVMV